SREVPRILRYRRRRSRLSERLGEIPGDDPFNVTRRGLSRETSRTGPGEHPKIKAPSTFKMDGPLFHTHQTYLFALEKKTAIWANRPVVACDICSQRYWREPHGGGNAHKHA